MSSFPKLDALDNTAVPNEVKVWFKTAEAKVSLHKIDLSAKERVLFYAGTFSGELKNAWTALQIIYLEQPEKEIVTVTALQKWVLELAAPDYSLNTAWEELLGLSLKSSITDYISEFRRKAAALPQLTEEDKILFFKRGLPPAFRVAIASKTVRTIEELYVIAREIEKQMGAQNGTWRRNTPPAQWSNGPMPMELDAMRGEKKFFPQGPRRERLPVKCWNCQQFGHTALTCGQQNRRSSGGKGRLNNIDHSDYMLRADLFDKIAELVGNFNVDACANDSGDNSFVKTNFYSRTRSFLHAQLSDNECVWMNPPFSNPEPFVRHLLSENCYDSLTNYLSFSVVLALFIENDD